MTENLEPQNEAAPTPDEGMVTAVPAESTPVETPAGPIEPDFAGLDLTIDSPNGVGPTNQYQRTPWDAKSYTPHVNKSGAAKLASSGVAPIIAAARGYESIDKMQSADFAKRHAIGDARTKRGQQFTASFRDGGDVLVLPWYSVARIANTAADLERSPATSIQIRPEVPRVNPVNQKPIKYEFLVNSDTVIDFHPAVTAEWAHAAPRYMIAEGLLKGDSALTAQLRQYVSDEELKTIPSDGDQTQAMRRLAGLLEKIPQAERVAIVTIAGVGNWKNNPEWSYVNVKEKDVMIAFDGDIDDNYNVWNQARQLMEFVEKTRKGFPQLVLIRQNDLALTAMSLGDDHMGLDDFFHHVGDWDGVEEMLSGSLPAMPKKNNDVAGQWRVSENGFVVEECVDKNPDGTETVPYWVERIALGGRIQHFDMRRGATDAELKGAAFGTDVDESNYPMFCSIEVTWKDELTERAMRAEVTGPATLLNFAPTEWVRQGATLPKSLLRHPEWPPRKGFEWLQAVKRHRAEQTEDRTTWSTMGWVPVEGQQAQAFIAGNVVLAANEEAKALTRIGVDELALTSASKFGVHDVYTGPDFTDPTGEHDLVEDIRTVWDAFIDNGPWKTPEQAATVLAIALRPTVPLPNAVAAYFVGAPQQGKSYTAGHIMSFWQPRCGTWDSLPGNANDTFAGTEKAISQTPIWVADDLAPSTDKKSADTAEAKIGDLVRAVHNKLGKRRMNADMTSKEVSTPMAAFIVTAEFEHSVPSIKERLITVEFDGLVSENMSVIDELTLKDTAAARITAAIIRHFINLGESGWTELVESLNTTKETNTEIARALLTSGTVAVSDSSRPSKMIGDLSLGLTGLSMLAGELGMKDIRKKLGWAEGGLSNLLVKQVAKGQESKSESKPGPMLMDSIRNLLVAGHGHIVSLDNPGLPPISDEENAGRSNLMLGWQMNSQGDMSPRGVTIGWYSKVKNRKTGEEYDVIFLNRDDAFNEAQKRYPKRIQFGASSTMSWKNVWDLGLVHPKYIGYTRHGVVVQFSGHHARPYGIPVSVEGLFPWMGPDEPEDTETATPVPTDG